MRFLLLAASAALLLALTAPDAHAQRRGALGIGGLIGEPTGLTLKFGTGAGAIALDAEWDFDDYVFVQGHYLIRERPFPGGSGIGYYYGPGLFVASAGGGDPAFGLSLNVGANYYTGPIEIFGQLTPQLLLSPETDGDLGAAIGLRFYP